jgi:DNA repair protein RadC
MIKDIPVSERPRERVLSDGVESLSNSELLSIILRCGTKDKSVKDLSLEVISLLKRMIQ